MLLSFLSLLSVAASPFNLSQANLLQFDSQIDFSPTGQQIVQTQIAQTQIAQTQIAQTQIAQNQSNIITVPQTVRPLPGGLDTVPVFNSNSPEIIESDGILLSTFPSRGKSAPSAHLNYPLSGRFDIFSHHVARGQDERDDRTIYKGIIVHNPGDRAVTLSVREGASYISQESAWNQIASGTSNLYSDNFSGPGSRVVNDVLRDRRHTVFPAQVTIPARSYCSTHRSHCAA